MSEAGIPFSISALTTLEATLIKQADDAINCAAAGGVLIEGEGSVQSQREFMARCIEDVLPVSPDFLSHPLLAYTEKARELSWNSENRRLIASHLPDSHPSRGIFECADKHSSAQKLVSSYTFHSSVTGAPSQLTRQQPSSPSSAHPTSALPIPPGTPYLLDPRTQAPRVAPSRPVSLARILLPKHFQQQSKHVRLAGTPVAPSSPST
jgi:hypothetical protein